MTKESVYLLGIAREIADAFIGLPGARAAMVFGSVAQGVSDRYSDIDMGIYYDALPPEADLLAAVETVSDGGLRWRLGDHGSGTLILAFPRFGVECQVVQATVARMEQDMDSVLAAEQVKTPLQKILSGVQDGVVLYGEPLMNVWKERANQYPTALGRAMVQQHLSFFPIWAAYDWLGPRDITLWFYQILTEAVFNLLGALSGVNGIYFADFQLKRTGKLIAKMEWAPPDLAARIEAVFRSEPPVGARLLRDLVEETVAIVEARMPDVDTGAVRKGLDWVCKPWEPRREDIALPGGGG